MKSIIAAIIAVTAFSANFATAASFSEAPEFRSDASKLTRTQVVSAIMGAASLGEATVITPTKSTLARAEVAKQAFDATNSLNYRFNELTASGTN
jgi:hypothetical protein